MHEIISSNAMIYAILSINSEVALQKDYLASPELPPADRGEEQGILDDMEQALMEFITLYKSRCKEDKNLPNIDELLTTEL